MRPEGRPVRHRHQAQRRSRRLSQPWRPPLARSEGHGPPARAESTKKRGRVPLLCFFRSATLTRQRPASSRRQALPPTSRLSPLLLSCRGGKSPPARSPHRRPQQLRDALASSDGPPRPRRPARRGTQQPRRAPRQRRSQRLAASPASAVCHALPRGWQSGTEQVQHGCQCATLLSSGLS